MMRSLFSGVSGLKTHQSKMDVIGNNIANVNTVAYKSQSTTFQDLLYQTSKAATGASAATGRAGTNASQVGLGVKTGAISTSITTAGSAQSTGNPFDINLTGDSFFVVSDGSKNYYTRSGTFAVDANGTLCMSTNGYTVMGWNANDEGTVIKSTVQRLDIMSAKNMNSDPEQTTEGYMTGIIDKNDTQLSSNEGQISTVQFFDEKGFSYIMKFAVKSYNDDPDNYYMVASDILDAATGKSIMTYEKFGKTAEETPDGDATKELEVDDKMKVLARYNLFGDTFVDTASPSGKSYVEGNSVNLVYDKVTGKWDSKTGATVGNITDANLYASIGKAGFVTVDHATGKKDALAKAIVSESGFVLNLGNLSKFSSLTGAAAIVQSTKTYKDLTTTPASDKPVEFDLSTLFINSSLDQNMNINVTSTRNIDNDGTTTLAGKTGEYGNTAIGAGRSAGVMDSIAIGTDGTIVATYTNGISKTLAQIVVANFANASGLQKEGDNLYSSTQNSGDFDGIGSDVTSDGGTMNSGYVEMSNVDLSNEFTDMITTQRGFQANSRIITVSDTMLEELVNLKR